MPALGVVKALQVAEDASLGLLAGLIVGVFDLLSFEGGEETFHYGVVVAVTLARHALANAVGFQRSSKPGAGILNPLDALLFVKQLVVGG